MTVAPPLSRLHLVPALLSAALICVLLGLPGHRASSRPGAARQAKKAAAGTAARPGKKAAKAARRPGEEGRAADRRHDDGRGQGAARPARPKKRRRRASTRPGEEGGGDGATGQAKPPRRRRTRAPGKQAGAPRAPPPRCARSRAAARRRAPLPPPRRRAARAAAAGTARRRRSGRGGRRQRHGRRRRAALHQRAPPATASRTQDRQAKRTGRTQFLPVPPRDELPQPAPRRARHRARGAARRCASCSPASSRSRSCSPAPPPDAHAQPPPRPPAAASCSGTSACSRPPFSPWCPRWSARSPRVGGLPPGRRARRRRRLLRRAPARRRPHRGRDRRRVRPRPRRARPHGAGPLHAPRVRRGRDGADEALQVAGSVLAGKLEGDFVTALIAVHDAAAGTLTYASAGHPPPIVVSSAGFDPVARGRRAAARSRRRAPASARRRSRSRADSTACFYTDGLSEARMASGRLGDADLERLVRELGPGATAEQVIERVAKTSATIARRRGGVRAHRRGGRRDRPLARRVARAELAAGAARADARRLPPTNAGSAVRAVRAAERDAREVARESGGAVIEVRMGDRPDVDVPARPHRRPPLSVRLSDAAPTGVSTSVFRTGQTNPKIGCDWNESENEDVGDACAPEPLARHRRRDLLSGDPAAVDLQHVDAAVGVGRVDDLAVRVRRRPVRRPRRAVRRDVVADLLDVFGVACSRGSARPARTSRSPRRRSSRRTSATSSSRSPAPSSRPSRP